MLVCGGGRHEFVAACVPDGLITIHATPQTSARYVSEGSGVLVLMAAVGDRNGTAVMWNNIGGFALNHTHKRTTDYTHKRTTDYSLTD